MDGLWRGLIGSLFGGRPSSAPLEPNEPQERRANTRAGSSIKVTLQWTDSRGEARATLGMLENVSSHGCAMRAKVKLRQGQTVLVCRPEAPVLKCVVRNVRRDAGAYVLGCALISQERRREDRRPVQGGGSLKWSGPNGEPVAASIKILNVSAEGVQVASPLPAPVGEVVRLSGTAVECTGAVRYCTPAERGFLIGLFLIGKAQRKAS